MAVIVIASVVRIDEPRPDADGHPLLERGGVTPGDTGRLAPFLCIIVAGG